LAGLRYEARDHRLDSEGARALDRHRDVRALPARQPDDLLQHHLVDGEEVGVARTPIVNHGLLDTGRGGERPRRQQQRIAGFGLSGVHGHGRFMGSRPLCVQYIIHMPSIDYPYMTPTQLRAFHLVAESGSFSAAARASGLSQPNLSSQVTALEQAYG